MTSEQFKNAVRFIAVIALGVALVGLTITIAVVISR